MTPRGVLRVAWSQRLWLVAPVVAFGVAGFLVGQALYNRVTVTSSRLLEVTPGAEADALFACTSNDVLERALATTGLDGRLPAGQLADATTVEIAGDNKLLLSVTRDSGEDAERLVQAIANEAGRAVSVMASDISAADMDKISKVEDEKRRLEARHTRAQRNLSKIMTEHPFHIGTHGEVMSATRRRLIDAQAALATGRRELAAADAEIASLKEKLASRATPAEGDEDEVRSPAATALRKRIAAVDVRLEALRSDFTDLHPRVVRVLTEREKLAAELASLRPESSPSAGIASLDDVRRRLVEKETEHAGVASRVATYEEEEKGLSEYVKTEAAAFEEEARRNSATLRDAAGQLETVQRKLGSARRAAEENRGSRAAVTMRGGKTPPRVRRAAGSPLAYAGFGALVGLLVGALLAALAEVINPILRTTEDVKRHLGLPVLAIVPAGSLHVAPPAKRTGALGSVLLALVFLVIAALLLLAVYPGWGEIRRYVRTRSANGASDTSEVTK